MAHTIYLAFGSNLGDRLENFRRARRALPPAVNIRAASPVYETPPWGYRDQPPFLNQALRAETGLPPIELLGFIKRLERQLGRLPGDPNGPRPIDLDLLFYDDLVLDAPGLVIPHPRMARRGFVLLPLADLAPDLIHPLLKRRISDLLAECDLAGIRRYVAGDYEMDFIL